MQIVKEMSHRVMDHTVPPTRLWCFVVDYVIDVWHHLANQNNSWRTPIEKLTGHTPDISKFRLFSFFDPIKYLDSDVKFPKSKVLTGKFLGYEPDKGDIFVYRILPEYLGKGEVSTHLTRSVVEPDNLPHFRTGKMRSLPSNMACFEPNGTVPRKR